MILHSPSISSKITHFSPTRFSYKPLCRDIKPGTAPHGTSKLARRKNLSFYCRLRERKQVIACVYGVLAAGWYRWTSTNTHTILCLYCSILWNCEKVAKRYRERLIVHVRLFFVPSNVLF